MQQMAELVENRLHIAMREQRRLTAQRFAEVAADEAQVRLKAAVRRAAGDQRIHPGAAALVFARIPVGVESADESTVLVVDVVIGNLLVPSGHALFFADGYT